ncbi:YihY/virulence factor BrkB family protein [Erythrobacter sp. HKB08]|uniref:YihY/virulence factor BrkB family protein n=1 Tax=Erythrobacter sp. HKB08 TaxID=2502843 RepID=UPI0010086BA6|nr:YihY/virulence factor BrkB family protein [Erythrobacter sp. HKB08]
MLTLLKRAWARSTENTISLTAAGIAYFAFLAMVPLLAVAVLIYGLVAEPATVARHVAVLASNLPASAADLVGEQLRSVVEGSKGAKGLGLLTAFAVSLFSARSGAGSIITALNVAFCADETRNILKFNLVAILLTIGALVAFGVSAFAIAATSALGGIAASIAAFALLGATGFGGAALAYRVAPHRRQPPRWPALWPGALLFAIGWLIATSAFGYYSANFANYNATYGSLGAVIVLLTWLYLSAFLFLFGAELNAARERHAEGSQG